MFCTITHDLHNNGQVNNRVQELDTHVDDLHNTDIDHLVNALHNDGHVDNLVQELDHTTRRQLRDLHSFQHRQPVQDLLCKTLENPSWEKTLKTIAARPLMPPRTLCWTRALRTAERAGCDQLKKIGRQRRRACLTRRPRRTAPALDGCDC